MLHKKRINLFARITTKYLTIVLMMVFNACEQTPDPVDPDDPTDKFYKTTITLDGDDKLIKDGSTAYFIQTDNPSEKDTIFSTINNQEAKMQIPVVGKTLSGTIGIKENKGYEETKKPVTFKTSDGLNEQENLSAIKKEHMAELKFNTTRAGEPIGNVGYAITPGTITGTTNEQGNATEEYPSNTNENNEQIKTDIIYNFAKTPTTEKKHTKEQ